MKIQLTEKSGFGGNISSGMEGRSAIIYKPTVYRFKTTGIPERHPPIKGLNRKEKDDNV